MCRCFDFFSDSFATWIPSASENASAIAIIKIPPRTASFEPVPELSPTIIPRVVITPEVSPKLTPLFIDSFIFYLSNGSIKGFCRIVASHRALPRCFALFSLRSFSKCSNFNELFVSS